MRMEYGPTPAKGSATVSPSSIRSAIRFRSEATPDGHESFVKLCLFRGKTDLDAFSNRQEDCAVLMAYPKVFQEQALRLEGSPNLLRTSPRNDNGPRPHGGCDERGC